MRTTSILNDWADGTYENETLGWSAMPNYGERLPRLVGVGFMSELGEKPNTQTDVQTLIHSFWRQVVGDR